MYSLSQKILAWSVHVFTSLGILAAFFAIMAIDQEQWRTAFIWLFICLLIDGIDGSLARKFSVEQVLPNMSGKSIDYVIDFVSYAIVPAFFFYKAEMVSAQWMVPTVIIILISSALYYGKNDMVADGQFFVGFPVLWNVVVFFMFFVFQNTEIINLIGVLIFGVLHFIPMRYAYPSRARKNFIGHMIASIVGLSAAAMIIWKFPVRVIPAEWITVIIGSYFFLFAILDSFRKY